MLHDSGSSSSPRSDTKALANAYAAHQRYDEAVGALRYVQHDATMGNKARLLIEEYSAQGSRG